MVVAQDRMIERVPPPTAAIADPMTRASVATTVRRSIRRRQFTAALLVAPMLFFVLFAFVGPILFMLYRSIDNPEVVDLLPRTLAALETWDGEEIPSEAAFSALRNDLVETEQSRSTAIAGKRLNFNLSGFRRLLTRTGRKIVEIESGPWRETFIKLDEEWANLDYWREIKRNGMGLTPDYLLASVDWMQQPDGSLASMPAKQSIYQQVLIRTFWISALVCLLCLILGYPAAMLLATAPPRIANLLMIFVLLPFWTSLLVRSTAWVVLLQNQGILNKAFIGLGLVETPLELIFNRVGVLIAMTHVLLPFMVLPLYSVMRNISPSYLRASLSLGARPIMTFLRVYLPLSMPGIVSGSLLVFILALGYYITPALVGGASDQMISYFIAFHTGTSLNWGMAAALATLLMVCVVLLYTVYTRLADASPLRLG